jgi:hypothetical protein
MRWWPWLLVLVAGCAHAQHARWDPASSRLCTEHLCYRTGPLGPDWRAVHQEGAAIGFFSDRAGAVISSNATCRDDADAASLRVLTTHLLVGYTDRHVLSQERVELDRREALHTVLDVRLDGVPMVLELYVLKRNGCIFDLSLAAPPGWYPAARPAFARFVAGFVDERAT